MVGIYEPFQVMGGCSLFFSVVSLDVGLKKFEAGDTLRKILDSYVDTYTDIIKMKFSSRKMRSACELALGHQTSEYLCGQVSMVAPI